ncbi:MAG: efflux RND transporter periplasmic adaptor subunit [Massilia sp.]
MKLETVPLAPAPTSTPSSASASASASAPSSAAASAPTSAPSSAAPSATASSGAPAAASPRPARRRWRKLGLGLAIVAVAGAAFAWRQASQTPPPAPVKAAAKAEVYELASGDVGTIEERELTLQLPLSGSLTPLTQATVKSKASGVVMSAPLLEGASVTAGQIIARLDSSEQQARLAQQQATVDEAGARLALAQKNKDNSAALLAQKFIAQSAYDTAQNNVDLASASLAAARAQRDMARIALADGTIRAPLSGVISKRHVQAGEKLAPDMPVYTIVNLRELTLEAQVPAADITRVKVGQEVRFQVDGHGQRAITGKVARINPTTEAGSRAMLVYISVDNADAALRGGMFAKGAITTEKSRPRPLLPLAALRSEHQQQVVYALENNKVVVRPVKLGLRNEDEAMAEVTEGLAAGARVLVAKLDGLKPGAAVKLMAPAVAASKG